MSTFAGAWYTTFGIMHLEQVGTRVEGTYGREEAPSSLKGKSANGRLTFTYAEEHENGEGWFELSRRGHAFAGEYRPQGSAAQGAWEGTRISFNGLWDSTFGLLRLLEEGELIRGFYEPGATIEGGLSGQELTFTYQEQAERGKGRFILANDGLSFDGKWQPEGSDRWSSWTGDRVVPRPELTWLVVIEAPWQRHLMEREYSFGRMLDAFFARLTWVEVRHRFFTNEESLQQYCREVMYLAEPVVLVLATHALPDGITVNGRTIAILPLLEWLRHAPDLRLVHFSACLLMKDPAMRAQLQTFSDQAGLPVSGYSTSVNWGASAILEFTYLELILCQEYDPAEAASLVQKILPFAGKSGPAKPFAPTGFRIVTPRG